MFLLLPSALVAFNLVGFFIFNFLFWSAAAHSFYSRDLGSILSAVFYFSFFIFCASEVQLFCVVWVLDYFVHSWLYVEPNSSRVRLLFFLFFFIISAFYKVSRDSTLCVCGTSFISFRSRLRFIYRPFLFFIYFFYYRSSIVILSFRVNSEQKR